MGGLVGCALWGASLMERTVLHGRPPGREGALEAPGMLMLGRLLRYAVWAGDPDRA
jgi:hypothetical protein